ncbi:hypothetical protein [Pseudomonas entomophila]|uniref:hypothetical protein n=1 Tax=Pseudomonas entomophila TaxID=312306 RepID=UPI00200E6ED8|nr:hypothetical protein [Pseudomonas entomophila]
MKRPVCCTRTASHFAGSWLTLKGGKVLQDLRYAFDPVGNVVSVRNDAQEARCWHNQKVVPESRYRYDSLYQLVRAEGREMANAGQQGPQLPLVKVPIPIDNSAYTNYTRTYRYDDVGSLTQIRHSPATGTGYTTDVTISDRSNRGVLSSLTDSPPKWMPCSRQGAANTTAIGTAPELDVAPGTVAGEWRDACRGRR